MYVMSRSTKNCRAFALLGVDAITLSKVGSSSFAIVECETPLAETVNIRAQVVKGCYCYGALQISASDKL